MRRDPMACVLGNRDHVVNAKRKSLAEEFKSLKRAVDALQRDIDRFPMGESPELELRAHKLVNLWADKVARLQLIADMIAEGKTFR